MKDTSKANHICGFHLITEPHGCFSNWFPSDFTYAGTIYHCAEQYMMAQKVAMGRRFDLLEKIMEERDPEVIKNLAGKDSFPEFILIKDLWDKHCLHIVKRGVMAKFQQNPAMLRELLRTGDDLLCECAGQDKIWGIGINLRDPAWQDVSNWRGKNYLGILLMEIREILGREMAEKGSVQYIDFSMAKPIPQWSMTAKELKRIPQYTQAIHAYADQLQGISLDAFLSSPLEEAEKRIKEGAQDYPYPGFYEMKQEIYETARRLAHQPFVSDIFRVRPKSLDALPSPSFWESLTTAFAFDPISMTEEEFKEKVQAIFKELDQPGHNDLSAPWSENKYMPMLQRRLRRLKDMRPQRDVLKILIKSGSGFGPIMLAYQEALTITKEGIEYDYQPKLPSKTNAPRNWSYKTSRPAFQELYEALAEQVEEILRREEAPDCKDIGPITFVITYADNTRKECTFFLPRSEFSEALHILGQMIPKDESAMLVR